MSHVNLAQIPIISHRSSSPSSRACCTSWQRTSTNRRAAATNPGTKRLGMCGPQREIAIHTGALRRSADMTAASCPTTLASLPHCLSVSSLKLPSSTGSGFVVVSVFRSSCSASMWSERQVPRSALPGAGDFARELRALGGIKVGLGADQQTLTTRRQPRKALASIPVPRRPETHRSPGVPDGRGALWAFLLGAAG